MMHPSTATQGAVRAAATLGLTFLLLLALTARAAEPAASRNGAAELTPQGTLRVGLILANPVLVTRDGAGELRGVAVDLGRAVAARLGVPFVPVGYPTVAGLVDSAGRGEWDIAFLALDPARAAAMDFSAPYMEVDNTYLLPPGSPLTAIEDVDRHGVRVAVPAKSAPDLFLSRSLQQATLVRGPGGAKAAAEILAAGGADAFAENRQFLLSVAAQLPGARVLAGRFSAVQHAVALPKGRPAAHASLHGLMESLKASGAVEAAIRAAGLAGAGIAPPAAPAIASN